MVTRYYTPQPDERTPLTAEGGPAPSPAIEGPPSMRTPVPGVGHYYYGPESFDDQSSPFDQPARQLTGLDRFAADPVQQAYLASLRDSPADAIREPPIRERPGDTGAGGVEYTVDGNNYYEDNVGKFLKMARIRVDNGDGSYTCEVVEWNPNTQTWVLDDQWSGNILVWSALDVFKGYRHSYAVNDVSIAVKTYIGDQQGNPSKWHFYDLPPSPGVLLRAAWITKITASYGPPSNHTYQVRYMDNNEVEADYIPTMQGRDPTVKYIPLVTDDPVIVAKFWDPIAEYFYKRIITPESTVHVDYPCPP